MSPGTLVPLLSEALLARLGLFDEAHQGALRLFNGFLEGFADLVVECYGRTLVLLNYADPPEKLAAQLNQVQEFYLSELPWVQAVVVKERHADLPARRRGIIQVGEQLDTRVREQGVWYALDLRLNQDTSLYLDTRGLRRWALLNLAGKTVLNTFAYTGSLGVAACAGGAHHVVQVDHKKAFLDLARLSYSLNGFPVEDGDLVVANFFTLARRLRLSRTVFDCVFLDPPFFSTTLQGTVDLVNQNIRLINKVRPLVSDRGWLVVINNALFVSGADFMHVLEDLCVDQYLSIETIVPVPQDIVGYTQMPTHLLPADPTPFNYSTKIAVLRVRRKD